MELRPYQSESIAAVYEHLRTRDDNPCVVIPTGGGKTPVIATICRDAVTHWDGRVVILAHVKELLEQAADKLRHIAPDVPVGIYSAGLKRKDLGYAVTVAGIQSIWKKAGDLGKVDLILVDEAHMVPAAPPQDDGMYRQFIADAKVANPHVRIIVLTAAPVRKRKPKNAATNKHAAPKRRRRARAKRKPTRFQTARNVIRAAGNLFRDLGNTFQAAGNLLQMAWNVFQIVRNMF